jgi:hypothetical protein
LTSILSDLGTGAYACGTETEIGWRDLLERSSVLHRHAQSLQESPEGTDTDIIRTWANEANPASGAAYLYI